MLKVNEINAYLFFYRLQIIATRDLILMVYLFEGISQTKGNSSIGSVICEAWPWLRVVGSYRLDGTLMLKSL